MLGSCRRADRLLPQVRNSDAEKHHTFKISVVFISLGLHCVLQSTVEHSLMASLSLFEVKVSFPSPFSLCVDLPVAKTCLSALSPGTWVTKCKG